MLTRKVNAYAAKLPILPKVPHSAAKTVGKTTPHSMVPEPVIFSKKMSVNPPVVVRKQAKSEPVIFSESTKQTKINDFQNNGVKKLNPPTRHPGPYAPNRELPTDIKSGVGIPDPEALGRPHTQLGIQESQNKTKNYVYTKAREFDADGIAVRDLEFTDHLRKDHPNPHQHRWIPNETGGTRKRGGFEPLDIELKNAQDFKKTDLDEKSHNMRKK